MGRSQNWKITQNHDPDFLSSYLWSVFQMHKGCDHLFKVWEKNILLAVNNIMLHPVLNALLLPMTASMVSGSSKGQCLYRSWREPVRPVRLVRARYSESIRSHWHPQHVSFTMFFLLLGFESNHKTQVSLQ